MLNKKWNTGVVQVHVETPLIPLINCTHGDNPDKDFMKLKLRRDQTSEISDLYEFKMTLFENGDPEEFVLFIHNFNMTLDV